LVHVGVGVDIGPVIKEEAGGVKVAVLGGDVEKGRAAQCEHTATGSSADQFRVAAVHDDASASSNAASSSVRPRRIGKTPGTS
jgi:hypothetical protein